MVSKLKVGWGVLKETINEWIDDNAQRLGAALAYYTVLALPPLFVILFFIAGLYLNEKSVRSEVFDQINGLIGKQGGEALQSVMATPQKQKQGAVASIIAIGALLATTTGLFLELQGSLNTVWGVRVKPGQGIKGFIKNRLLSFAMLVGIAFLLLVSLLVSTGLAAANKYFSKMGPDVPILWQALNMGISFAVITVLFAMMFKVLPDVKIAWRDVWVGAALTSLLFTIGKSVLGVYLGRSETASAYGAAGSLVIILLWVYYSAQILFFGAEFTQVYACRFGKKMEPAKHAEWVEETARNQGREEGRREALAELAEAREAGESIQPVNRVEREKQIIQGISRRVESWHDIRK